MEKLFEFIKLIFTTPLSQLDMIQFACGIGVILLLCILIKKLFKFVRKFFNFIKNLLKMVFSSKYKCRKIVCNSCGRTLDRCVCKKNEGKGNFSRLYNYKKELRERRR